MTPICIVDLGEGLAAHDTTAELARWLVCTFNERVHSLFPVNSPLAPAARVAGAGAEGVVIIGVDSSGVAADQGFSTGDVILEVAGKSVSTPTDVREVITTARTQGKRTVLVRVKKGNNTRFVALPLGRG